MMRPERLRAFGQACLAGFLACAVVTATTGLITIWRDRDAAHGPPFPEPSPDVVELFLSAFLLTVLTGLLTSGTRSALRWRAGPIRCAGQGSQSARP